MGRIDRLAKRYGRFIAPALAEGSGRSAKSHFRIVYDKGDERRLRVRKDLFRLATEKAGHGWIECDLTGVFSQWMASTEYRESYFESPQDLELKLEDDFPGACGRVRWGSAVSAGSRITTPSSRSSASHRCSGSFACRS